MTNQTKPAPEKLGFWKRVALTIEAMEKTEFEYMQDEIAQIRMHQREMKENIHSGVRP